MITSNCSTRRIGSYMFHQLAMRSNTTISENNPDLKYLIEHRFPPTGLASAHSVKPHLSLCLPHFQESSMPVRMDIKALRKQLDGIDLGNLLLVVAKERHNRDSCALAGHQILSESSSLSIIITRLGTNVESFLLRELLCLSSREAQDP